MIIVELGEVVGDADVDGLAYGEALGDAAGDLVVLELVVAVVVLWFAAYTLPAITITATMPTSIQRFLLFMAPPFQNVAASIICNESRLCL
jgi:hypothetical protein